MHHGPTPGHLYLRIGRYADAVEANRLAASADQLYTDEGLSPYGPCHNIYFGVYAACMAGMKVRELQHAQSVDLDAAPSFSVALSLHGIE